MNEPPSSWQVVLLRQPEKTLRTLPGDLLQRMRAVIQGLEQDPRPHGCKKLTGHEDIYRIRVGHWRIVYAIESEQMIVLIIEIGPRGRAYRSF